MNRAITKKPRGFSLLELMIAMAIGLIIMAGASQLFQSGMNATILVTETAEMQQNVRSALNLIARDTSMAGAGLPLGGLSLPYGSGSSASDYACNQAKTCYLSADTYPSGTVSGSTVSNYMYGLIPGPGNGMESGGVSTITATNAGADSITSVYVDYSFPLSSYSITLNTSTTPITISATPPSSPPSGFPAIISPTGISVGDLILLTNNSGSVVGEVTKVAALGSNGGGTITFANTDPLNVNQSGAASASLSSISSGGTIQANRLLVVSYWIEVPATGSGQTPRLMRQVNGQTAVPVADNIIGLKFTYDMCDGTTGSACAAISDPIGGGFSPNQINKVNIQVMGQSVLTQAKNQSRSMALVTSVSTPNMSYTNRY